MMGKILLATLRLLVALIAAGGIVAVELLAYELADRLALLVMAVIFGGLSGGFTLALAGGETYGLKMPGRANDNSRLAMDPGFLGDMAVGMLTAFLAVGFANQLTTIALFDANKLTSASEFAGLWFANFGFAYVAGYLGLKLVKRISDDFIKQLNVSRLSTDVEGLKSNYRTVAADSMCTLGNQAINLKQYGEAEMLFQSANEIESANTVRSEVGLARALRWQDRFPEAQKLLDKAIAEKGKEKIPGRLSVAYWNRACYRALSDGLPAIDEVITDLKEAFRLNPAMGPDDLNDVDLDKVRPDPKFIALVDEVSGR